MNIIQQAINFILNNKVSKSQINENISLFRKKLPKRFIFEKLKEYSENFLSKSTNEPRMIGIVGLRGVGKTTLLWQLADYIINNFQKANIFYLSLDLALSYGFKITDIIEAIDKIKQEYYYDMDLIFLFDEVQYLPKWDLMLKIIYDKHKNIFIIATGSSSLSIYSNVDLSSRWNIESLYPLSFTEFVLIRSYLKTNKKILPIKYLSENIKNIIFYSENIIDLKNNILKLKPKIEEYLNKIKKNKKAFFENILHEYIFFHNIPRLLLIEDQKVILTRVLEMIKRVVSQDIKEYYKEDEIENVNRLLFYLAFTDEFNIEKLSSQFEISKEKIRKIIDSLIKAEIITKFPSLGGIKTRITKSEKIFFISPTIRYSIIRNIYENNKEKFYPKLYEDIVALYLKRLIGDLTYYKKENKSKTPDFIIKTNNKPVAIEVGTHKKKISQVNSEEFRYGIIINIEIDDIKTKENVIFLPLQWFLLM